MSKVHVTSSRFCLYLLHMYHFTYTFSHAQTEAHTLKHTCTISTQEAWRHPDTGAWLRGAEERLCWSEHTEKRRKNLLQKPDIHESKKSFVLPEKILCYFIRSNKSNINQRGVTQPYHVPILVFLNPILFRILILDLFTLCQLYLRPPIVP